jgi:probable HAF family extracellular repeat protein
MQRLRFFPMLIPPLAEQHRGAALCEAVTLAKIYFNLELQLLARYPAKREALGLHVICSVARCRFVGFKSIGTGEVMGFMAHRALKCFVFVLLTVGLPATAAQGAAYTILDLGTLGGTMSRTGGYNVLNASGQVVGDSTTGTGNQHAFRTAANGAIVQGVGASDLGTLGGATSQAYGINASGQVVGYAFTIDSFQHAFRTAANAPIIQGAGGSDLGTLGGTYSTADSVNASGQAVGEAATTGDASYHAFRTAANGVIVTGVGGSDLGTLGGSTSEAIGINGSGQAVGYAATAGDTAAHAFRTAANGPIVQGVGGSDLGTLGGTLSFAIGINASGQVVGDSRTTGDAVYHAFRTAANGPVVQGAGGSDLGTLGGSNSIAIGINAAGQVVGYSHTSGDATHHAFFADVTGPMVDLNTLIEPGSGWVLTSACGINDSGQIAGEGMVGVQTHAFLLTPTPEPSSLSPLALGCIALFCRNRRRSA